MHGAASFVAGWWATRIGKTLWDAEELYFRELLCLELTKPVLQWIDRLEDEPRGIYAGGWSG